MCSCVNANTCSCNRSCADKGEPGARGVQGPQGPIGPTGPAALTTPFISVSAIYPITTSDYTINCTANTFTVTLPTAVGVTGRIYVIKNSGGGIITLATTGGQTIDGSATQTVNPPISYTVQSDGSDWILI